MLAGAAVGSKIRRAKPKKRALRIRCIVDLRFRNLPALYRKDEVKTRAPLWVDALLNGALARPMCYLLGMNGLRGKIVLVTGASGGIGKAIALEFARDGAVVVVSSRNEEKLQALAQQLNGAGGQAVALRCRRCGQKTSRCPWCHDRRAGRNGADLDQ